MGQLVYLDLKDLLVSLEIKGPQVQKGPRAGLGRVDLQDPWDHKENKVLLENLVQRAIQVLT